MKLIASLLVVSASTAVAADWPHWRGPNYDGISAEKLPADLDRAEVAWKAEVGTGFSTVSVLGKRVVTMGNEKEHDIVWCLDADTGKPLWEHRYRCALDPRYYEGGPGGTPTIEEATGSVYTLSKKGHVYRLDLEDGSVTWSRDLRGEYDLELPEWSFAGSPLIAGDLVVLNVGSAGWALDKKTGKTVWRSGKKRSGYATPVPYGDNAVLIFSATELLALAVADGDVLWRHPWESSRDINSADPIVVGRDILISTSSGAALLSPPKAKGGEPTVTWQDKKKLRTYFNAGVAHGGHVYAIHGTTHNPTELICLEIETGKQLWSERGYGNGAPMAASGGEEMILFDKGQLTIFPSSAKGFEPRLQMQVLGGKCWTAPVLANGRVYCRNAKGQLACVELAPEG